MENKNKNTFRVVKFNETYTPPVNKYNKSKGFIQWGANNLYPDYLLELFYSRGGATHPAIIDKQIQLISGKGFEEIISLELKTFIKNNNLENEMKKAALDYQVFNGFSLEIIWSVDGKDITSISHIPFHKLRIGIPSDEYNYPHLYFSNKWAEYRKEMYSPEIIRTYNPFNKKGKQIYYYSQYSPSSDGLYPRPSYESAINWIELDYEVSAFHLNEVKRGYTPSMHVAINNSVPSNEEMDEQARAFNNEFAGSTGGKVFLTFAESTNEAATITPIQLNDSDRRFNILQAQTTSNIVVAAKIPQQLIVLTPGKLGSTQERAELLQEYNISYITPRQENMEWVLNDILSVGGYKEEVRFKNAIDIKDNIIETKK